MELYLVKLLSDNITIRKTHNALERPLTLIWVGGGGGNSPLITQKR